MFDERDSVMLQVATSHHNLTPGTGLLWSRVGDMNFTGIESVLNWLRQNPGQIEVGKMYRIVDLEDHQRMSDAEIRARVRNK
jgi:hypothetical protein